ncbi:MAG: type 4a pilus biogenesis protein PilO [bacterium]|nr:type 4a pilus biogenesis protein PilO [bacterium]
MAKEIKKNKLDTFIDGQYQTLDKKVKLLGLAALILVPLALFYFLLYGPKAAEQERLSGEIGKVKTEIQKAEAVIRNLAKHKAELEETQKKFEETVVMLPKTQEIPDLLRNISDLGKTTGLEFVSFVPAQEIQKDFYAEIPINITLLGPYHNVGSFLDKVSKLDRIVTVNNIKMAQPKEVTGEILLTSTCQLVTYRFTGQKLPDPKGTKK